MNNIPFEQVNRWKKDTNKGIERLTSDKPLSPIETFRGKLVGGSVQDVGKELIEGQTYRMQVRAENGETRDFFYTTKQEETDKPIDDRLSLFILYDQEVAIDLFEDGSYGLLRYEPSITRQELVEKKRKEIRERNANRRQEGLFRRVFGRAYRCLAKS